MSEINSDEKKYFNQYLYGIGYISNVRTITPPKGDPYLLVKVASLYGPEEDRSYTYFDCRVCGTVAKEVIKQCAHAVNSGETVLVRFILNGIWVVPYIYQQGEKLGQPGASIRANLLSVLMVMVNGDVIYTAPPKEDEIDAESLAQSDDVEPTDSPDNPGPSGACALPPTTDAEQAA
ncbi:MULTISPECIES: DUF3577 domain-containing protein [Pseudomonas]|uniref:DUF3577 domain-containing protein n=1 Tax=Pseudomonas TaxID=286 RepID=UPI0006B50265|nr:DUF3577 domain-containing protein [Pseudomonas fuscovaginae]KPA95904.1 Protein of unknown function (DUF3577) [Pseudomonas fuscovaginae]